MLVLNAAEKATNNIRLPSELSTPTLGRFLDWINNVIAAAQGKPYYSSLFREAKKYCFSPGEKKMTIIYFC